MTSTPKPTTAGPSLERRALIVSILITTVLGVMAVIWGLATGSSMILLDGVYSFVGVAVSWLLLRASALAIEEPSQRFHYGRQSTVPLVIGVQGSVLLATLLIAAFDAIRTTFDGGSEVAAGWALVYSVITCLASLATWVWLARSVVGSELIRAETTAWRIAALRGVGMIVGFTVMAVLQRESQDHIARYVDPAMVLLTCAVFSAAPVRMVRTTILELLEGAPPADLQERVMQAIGTIRAQFDLAEPIVRMTKVGPKLYVGVDAVVGLDVTVAQEDEVRLALRHLLSDLPGEVWLNVELSTDPSWGR